MGIDLSLSATPRSIVRISAATLFCRLVAWHASVHPFMDKGRKLFWQMIDYQYRICLATSQEGLCCVASPRRRTHGLTSEVPSPPPSDRRKLEADKSVFDSSRDRHTPLQCKIGLGQLILGDSSRLIIALPLRQSKPLVEADLEHV